MPNQIFNFTERVDREVALIDELELRRAGLVCLLRDWTKAGSITLSVFGSAAAFAEAEANATAPCRMVILSIGGTHFDDPEVLSKIELIRSSAPQASLAILSDHKDPRQIVAAFQSGAHGYLSMGTEPGIALRALGFILCGGSFFPPHALADLSHSTGAGTRPASRSSGSTTVPSGLTSRQQDVLESLRLGRSNKQIARELNMQEATVKVHIRQIMRKLGVKNRVQAAIEANRMFDAASAEPEHAAARPGEDQAPSVTAEPLPPLLQASAPAIHVCQGAPLARTS